MQNNIQIFESNEFGKLEVMMINGKPYFPASECATILGYKNPRKTIIDHCPHVTKRDIGVQTGVKADGSPALQFVKKSYITEGDVYRLIIRTKLPAAVRFESFVCDEVLPSIRTYGAYIHDDVLRKMREDREYADELIQRLIDEKVKNTDLQTYVEEIKPKHHTIGAFYSDSNIQKALLYSIGRYDDTAGAGTPSPAPISYAFKFKSGR